MIQISGQSMTERAEKVVLRKLFITIIKCQL